MQYYLQVFYLIDPWETNKKLWLPNFQEKIKAHEISALDKLGVHVFTFMQPNQLMWNLHLFDLQILLLKPHSWHKVFWASPVKIILILYQPRVFIVLNHVFQTLWSFWLTNYFIYQRAPNNLRLSWVEDWLEVLWKG